MTKIKFNGVEYDSNRTLADFVRQLGVNSHFVCKFEVQKEDKILEEICHELKIPIIQ